jgi:hypothetical protein
MFTIAESVLAVIAIAHRKSETTKSALAESAWHCYSCGNFCSVVVMAVEWTIVGSFPHDFPPIEAACVLRIHRETV